MFLLVRGEELGESMFACNLGGLLVVSSFVTSRTTKLMAGLVLLAKLSHSGFEFLTRRAPIGADDGDCVWRNHLGLLPSLVHFVGQMHRRVANVSAKAK